MSDENDSEWARKIERDRLSLEWLAKIERWAQEWKTVRAGGKVNPDVVKEIPRTEFHEVTSFGALFASKIDLIAAFNRARELAEEQGEPERMDVYVNLALADEVVTRLRDHRLVLADFLPDGTPVLVVPGSDTKKKEN
jgi:hypothetical protein